MSKTRNKRYLIVFIVLILLTLVGMIANLTIGNIKIEPSVIVDVLLGRGGDEVQRDILMQIRLPRMILATVLGGALAVAGFLLQTFFANPIAGPFILGISSGAKMVVALVLVFVIGGSASSSQLLLVGAAFAGSLMITGLIILISRRVRRGAALLAAGIMVGYICSAITDFMINFADNNDIVNLHSWSQGSFSGADTRSAVAAIWIVGISIICTMLLSKPIGAFQMGETYAKSMGVHVGRYRVILILLSSLLSASVTAFAGPISFIGIAVPFLMRELLRTAKPILLIPASFLGGSIFCLFSDLLARMLFAPTELNISTVTSLIGAPIVIYMLLTNKRGESA